MSGVCMVTIYNRVGRGEILVSLVICGGLYPYAPYRLAISSWRAVASQLSMCPAKPDIR